MIKGEDIKRLIPQREPFIMVDEFEEYDDNSAGTVLNVCPDNYFILPDGTMAETGLIEHLAQSCSALSGYKALMEASSSGEHQEEVPPPPVGLIGEVKQAQTNVTVTNNVNPYAGLTEDELRKLAREE